MNPRSGDSARATRRRHAGLLPSGPLPDAPDAPDVFEVPPEPWSLRREEAVGFLLGIFLTLVLWQVVWSHLHEMIPGAAPGASPGSLALARFAAVVGIAVFLAVGPLLMLGTAWRLASRQRLTVSPDVLVIERGWGWLRWKREVTRSLLVMVGIAPDGRRLVGETLERRVVLLTVASRRDLEKVFEFLRDETGLPTAGLGEGPLVPPPGWVVREQGEGAVDLWREAAWYAPVRDALLTLPFLVLALLVPTWFPGVGAFGATASTVLGFHLLRAGAVAGPRMLAARHLRVRGRTLEVCFGFPFTIRRYAFDSPHLRVDVEQGRKGADVYALTLTGGSERVRVDASSDFALPAIQLGRWLAARLHQKIELPSAFVDPR